MGESLHAGFLHLGAPDHGVSRYGRLLAGAARRIDGVSVTEREVASPGSPNSSDSRESPDSASFLAQLAAAAESLSACDVVHVQFNRALFGEGWVQPRAVAEVLRGRRAPVVVNLHDVYLENPWTAWRKQAAGIRVRWERLRHHVTRTLPTQRAIARLVAGAAASIVCFECERERLAALRGYERVQVIGHFVEQRPELPDRLAARKALGVEGRRVVSMLGYIHRRKGYDLAVDALAKLPDDVTLVFVGRATAEHADYLEELRRRAKKHAGDRLRVTEYVDESVLEQWLVATDVALCPFRFFSASGSLATWISAARPIVAHALPQIAEYRRFAPGAFHTFDRYEVSSLAGAISEALTVGTSGPDSAMIRLREEFSLDRVTQRTIAVYREVARSGGRPGT